ncbi:MAG: hypothetical protein IJV58_02460 [Oscillospiraceae bacterium]|nr:hypothetical protein [Oscillospiraceae bacterium]
MHLIMYHKHGGSGTDVLTRAAARGKQRRQSVYWDLLLLLLTAGTALCMSADLPWLPHGDALRSRLAALFLPCVLTASIRFFPEHRLYRGLLSTYALCCVRAMTLLAVMYYTADGLLGTSLPAVHTALQLCAGVYLTGSIRLRAARQKKSSLPGIVIFLLLAGCFLLSPDGPFLQTVNTGQPSSAMTSTSTSAPLGRSLTATQLLAGLPVIYLP